MKPKQQALKCKDCRFFAKEAHPSRSGRCTCPDKVYHCLYGCNTIACNYFKPLHGGAQDGRAATK